MGKQPPKMTALVVSAIRNLREIQGSTPREILNYIMAEYNASNPTADSAVQRKLCTALKRGLEYGILKKVHGHYSLNTDPETIAPAEDLLAGPMERGCRSSMKKRRRRKARSGRKGCGSRKSRSRRRRKRGGGGCGKKRRRASKRGKCGGGGRRKKSRGRRSRRGKKSCGGGKRRRGHRRARPRRSRRGKSCGTRRTGEEIDVLAKDPIETRHRENTGGGYTYDRERDRSQSRGRQSRSRSRSPSHSRSSGSSDREGNEGNRRQAE